MREQHSYDCGRKYNLLLSIIETKSIFFSLTVVMFPNPPVRAQSDEQPDGKHDWRSEERERVHLSIIYLYP